MDFDNPAYRLLTILEEGKKLDASISCRQAWSKLLAVPVDSPELFVRIGKVMELPSLIVSAIRFTYTPMNLILGLTGSLKYRMDLTAKA